MDTLAHRDKDHMGGLAKGLRLLESFDAAHSRLTVSEAARRTGLSAASARRCLLTLCSLGYLRSDGKYYAMHHGALRIEDEDGIAQRLADIGLECDLHRKVLRQIPIDQSDLHDRQP